MPSRLAFALARQPDAPARARDRAAAFLDDIPAAGLTDIELVLSELVTNAVRHGEGQVVVEIQRHDDHVRVEVIDEGEAAPQVRLEPPGPDGGWGLRVVNAIARRWGAYEGTTHVWCEIPL
jgi:anti-sigma regulatory factor (Ser/Thr protein kinase)